MSRIATATTANPASDSNQFVTVFPGGLMPPRSEEIPGSDSNQFVSLFPTEIGWMGIVGRVNVVRSVLVGHSSAASVRKAVQRLCAKWGQISLPHGRGSENFPSQCETGIGPGQASPIPQDADWHPELRVLLQEYAQGKRVIFSGFDLQLPPRTPFRDKVLAATRQLGYGEITTYGDLARLVGHPGAARAVGTVMSTNRFPILIPCHRVLAAGGKLGGYTSPAGTDLKQRLLDMEQAA